jgi:translation initiation factor IF-2
VDLPNANVQRTQNQLYSLGLIPDTTGGDTPFVETVAAKDRPRGIKELLDMISLVAELRELKANPKKPALGTCLEAKVTEGQGVVATLLVQNGTLHVGDCIVCGTTFGRVRAMFDSNGRPIQQAGPATPVAVTGLDDVPEAGHKFFVVPDLATAREIVERRRERLRFAEPIRRATFRLEDLDKTKVQELKIILKADVRGSIEAIKKELEKLKHEEIKLTVIHAGVGAITEGDVQLALASPEDTLIVGFNVVPDQRAQALAEQRHVQIRLYNIIYQLTEDLKAALEGRLKPREEVIPLGRAVVREVFKISKVGTVAGCYVVQGVVERGAQVRVIREGRIIYPPPDRTATIESLRRFKEDVREVREGFECGIKISNFDDVKVDDVLEVFRVVQVQRTLDEAAARPASS